MVATPSQTFAKNLRLIRELSGARCLVTGHTGFKGAWLCQWLAALGADVTGYSLQEPVSRPALFDLARVGDLVCDLRGDLQDTDALTRAISEAAPQVVFHLAAQPLVQRSHVEPKYTLDVNVGGTVNLLEAARCCPSVRAVVVITSDKCYENANTGRPFEEGDPLGGEDPYSASKACAEIVVASYRASFYAPAGVGLATARAGNVVGGGDWAEDRLIPDAVRALERGEAIGVRNPVHVRPWQHVLEPLFGYLVLGAGLLRAARDGDAGGRAALSGAWNFGPDAASCRTVQEVVEAYLQTNGGGRWEDLSRADAPLEARHLSLSWERARRELGWSPRWDFHQTFARTARWYRAQRDGDDARALCEADLTAYQRDETQHRAGGADHGTLG